MKLSDLKFDGTDYYQDENIQIFNSTIYCSNNFLKIVDINKLYIYKNNYKIQLYAYTILHSNSNIISYIDQPKIIQINIQIRLDIIKLLVTKYQNYIRKQKLNEIIGA